MAMMSYKIRVFTQGRVSVLEPEIRVIAFLSKRRSCGVWYSNLDGCCDAVNIFRNRANMDFM